MLIAGTLDNGKRFTLQVADAPGGGPGAPGAPRQPIMPKKRPTRRSDEGIAAVKAICASCPKQTKDEQGWPVCAACNCPLDHKILVASAKCPEGKWDREKDQGKE